MAYCVCRRLISGASTRPHKAASHIRACCCCPTASRWRVLGGAAALRRPRGKRIAPVCVSSMPTGQYRCPLRGSATTAVANPAPAINEGSSIALRNWSMSLEGSLLLAKFDGIFASHASTYAGTARSASLSGRDLSIPFLHFLSFLSSFLPLRTRRPSAGVVLLYGVGAVAAT